MPNIPLNYSDEEFITELILLNNFDFSTIIRLETMISNHNDVVLDLEVSLDEKTTECELLDDQVLSIDKSKCQLISNLKYIISQDTYPTNTINEIKEILA